MRKGVENQLTERSEGAFGRLPGEIDEELKERIRGVLR